MTTDSRQIRRASDYARNIAVWSRSDGAPGVFGQTMGQFRVRKGLRISMRVKTMLAGAVFAALVAAPAARAQTIPDPVDGGTVVGGTVNSTLELILSQPASVASNAKGLSSFPKAKTYTLSFDAKVIATDAPTLLTLADGDVTSGSKLGHLASGSKKLPLPLEARVGTAAFQPLNAPVDPLLKAWPQLIQPRTDALVNLRQKVTRKVSGTYRKVILVTLSPETP